MTAQKWEQPSVENSANLAMPHDSEVFYSTVEKAGYTAVHGSVEVDGATSKFTLDVPLALASERIMVDVNGFGAFKKTMRGFGTAMHELGHANLRSSPVRRSDRAWQEDWEDPTQVHVDQLEAIFEVIADGKLLEGVPNGKELNTDKSILVPHSYGGDPAVRFALEHPESVDGVVMLMPVGMEDPELLRFAKRFPGFFVKELLPFLVSKDRGLGISDGKKAVKHFFEDPVQTIAEVKTCVLADNRLALHQLRANKIGTALLSGNDDNLLPADAMETLASSLVDYYERLHVNHLGPQEKPKVVGQAAVRAAEALAELYAPPQLHAVK